MKSQVATANYRYATSRTTTFYITEDNLLGPYFCGCRIITVIIIIKLKCGYIYYYVTFVYIYTQIHIHTTYRYIAYALTP